MKHLIRWMAIVLLCITAGNATAALPSLTRRVFAQGDMTASALLGYGEGFTQKIAFERCMVDSWLNNRASMGLGAAVGNCIANHWDRLSLEVTASFHYQFADAIDTYATVGAGGGYRWYESPYGSDKGFFSWSTCAGIRWYFSSSFAMNIEAGYTFGSYILAGVCFRF